MVVSPGQFVEAWASLGVQVSEPEALEAFEDCGAAPPTSRALSLCTPALPLKCGWMQSSRVGRSAAKASSASRARGAGELQL